MTHTSINTAHLITSRRSIWNRIVAALLARDAAYRQRRALDELPEHLRRDIGLDAVRDPRGPAVTQWDAPEMMRIR